MAVLGSVASDHLVGAVVSLQREVHLEDVRAGLYQPEYPVTLGHLLFPGNPLVLHVVVNQSVLHQHAETHNSRRKVSSVVKLQSVLSRCLTKHSHKIPLKYGEFSSKISILRKLQNRSNEPLTNLQKTIALPGLVEVVLHHLEEPGVLSIRDVFQPVWDAPGAAHRRRGVEGGDPGKEGGVGSHQ